MISDTSPCKQLTFITSGELIFSPVFHYSELHLGLEGTLYILAAVVSSGAIFGLLFKPLDDHKEHKSEDMNGNTNQAFDLGLYDEAVIKDQKSESQEEFEDEIESCMEAHLIIFKSLPMVLVMLSHLLMHLGNINSPSSLI